MRHDGIEGLILEREEMTDGERQLFLSDLKQVCEEYFESDGRYSLDVTRSERGFSVCILFDARRVKRFKKPQ